MKSKKKKVPIIIAAVIIIIAAAGILLALKYNKKPVVPDVTSKSTQAASQTESDTSAQTVTAETESTEEKSSEEKEKETEKTILNTKSDKDYTPTAFEAKLFNAVNAKRKENAVKELYWNDCLHTAAKERADEAVILFSHTRPDGKKPSSVLSDKNISYTLFSECLLKGTKENDEGVSLLINGLLKEKSQSDAVLNADFSYAAVAVSLDENGLVTAVILFCNP